MSLRGIFVRLHRWVGLAIAAFLVMVGLTGSVIAFYHELDEWLNPELFRARSRGEPMPPLELAAGVEAAEPHRRVTYVPLTLEPGRALVLGLTGRTDPTFTEVFLDPVTGARLGERVWGACCIERKHLLPFIYKLHYNLHLPGLWGLWVMGVVGLVWALDCFIGFYLTLPARRKARAADDIAENLPSAISPSFWQRWKPAWQIKLDANPYRINFDVHRAAGLWFWALLLMLAVSGVYLSLPFDVFRPALSLMTPITQSPFDPARASAPVDPGVPFATVVATAVQEAERRGWQPPFDVFHSPEFGIYGVGFGDHHAPGTGVPYLYFDARTGDVRDQTVPGEGTAGDVFMQWLFPLHSGQIIGLPGRILISMTGLAVAVLSVTGVVIWAKKQRGRRAIAARAQEERAA
jgi:uncharacterized iron-regulated membrane protein